MRDFLPLYNRCILMDYILIYSHIHVPLTLKNHTLWWCACWILDDNLNICITMCHLSCQMTMVLFHLLVSWCSCQEQGVITFRNWRRGSWQEEQDGEEPEADSWFRKGIAMATKWSKLLLIFMHHLNANFQRSILIYRDFFPDKG